MLNKSGNTLLKLTALLALLLKKMLHLNFPYDLFFSSCLIPLLNLMNVNSYEMLPGSFSICDQLCFWPDLGSRNTGGVSGYEGDLIKHNFAVKPFGPPLCQPEI
jgi:hypothetical protein